MKAMLLCGLLFIASLTAIPASGPFLFDLMDSAGIRHTHLEMQKHRATVFVFLSIDCPLSNSYIPELNRIADEYGSKGFAVDAVYSDPSATASVVSAHARSYRLKFPALLDPLQQLARGLKATVTPEVAVVSRAGSVLYRGRIDDRTIAIGQTRVMTTHSDLRAVLDDAAGGPDLPMKETRAIGCAIPATRTVTNTRVTFCRDVAPILFKNCAACHHAGDAGPFPLLSFQDAAKRAELIAAVTSSGAMPPWKPIGQHGQFQNERRLSAREIAVLRAWAAVGAPEGNPTDLPGQPRFNNEWQGGTPDVVARMPRAFTVTADSPEIYRCFVLPLGLDRSHYLRAIEFRPGNRSAVHHALIFADSTGTARKNEAADAGAGYPCFGAPGFLGGGLGGWSPGNSVMAYPSGTAGWVRKGSDLVVQIHYHPTGKPETDQSSVGLYFTNDKPAKHLLDIPLGSRRIDIPAGETAYKVHDAFTLSVDVDAVGIIPHAHYLCKQMRGWATLPGGKTVQLLWIRDWDFNWQEQYWYRTPLRLPKNTRLEMEFVYDNSTGNPHNPNSPPERVTWGPGIKDEMAGLHIQVIAARPEDVPELTQDLWGKFMRSVGGSFYRLPEK